MFTRLSTQSGAQKQEETPPLLPEKVQGPAGHQPEAAHYLPHPEAPDIEEDTARYKLHQPNEKKEVFMRLTTQNGDQKHLLPSEKVQGPAGHLTEAAHYQLHAEELHVEEDIADR